MLVVNAGTMVLFACDKVLAIVGGPRVPEKVLCLTGVVGGWPGGILAMYMFRHKTKKPSFLFMYAISIGINIVCGVGVHFPGVVGRQVSEMMTSTSQEVQSLQERFEDRFLRIILKGN